MTRRTRRSAPTDEPGRAPVWLLLLALAAAIAAAVLYRDNPLSRTAQDQAQTVALSSAAVYVTLRSVNAFLSAAQEIEVGGSLVVSGTVQPLKTLEPVDDTIERIAGVVFFVMVATGLLAVAMGPVSAVGAGMLALALGLWIADRLIGQRDALVVLARRLSLYGLFLALAVPFSFLLSAHISDGLMRDVWDRNEAVINEIVTPLTDSASQDDEFQNRLWQAMESVEEYRAMAGNVYSRADELIGSYIAILAVFLFRVLLLPALLVGGFFVIVRFLASRP